MRFFDLHCDTLYKALNENNKIYNNNYDISLEKGEMFLSWFQCMAIWVPDDINSKYAFEHIVKANILLERQINEFNKISDKKAHKITDFKELNNINNSNKIGIIFTVEGGKGIVGDLTNIKKLKDMNVKIMTLTWNLENEIGTGCLSKEKYGITNFGRKVIKEMEKNKIIVDISHASQRLFYDVVNLSTKPIVATHSNSKTICDVPRNLTDEQFKIICDKKGIVGLNFVPEFINDKANSKRADLIKHCEHFLSLGGEDNLSIGSDFDGAVMQNELSSIEKIYPLYNDFLRLNYSDVLLEKIFFSNAYNFCENFDNC